MIPIIMSPKVSNGEGESNMMYLDRGKARKLAKFEYEKEGDNLESVVIQLQGDEFWNSETIWKNGKPHIARSFRCYGMSYWATPVVRFFYKDGKERVEPCYRKDKKFGAKVIAESEKKSIKARKALNKFLKGYGK